MVFSLCTEVADVDDEIGAARTENHDSMSDPEQGLARYSLVGDALEQ